MKFVLKSEAALKVGQARSKGGLVPKHPAREGARGLRVVPVLVHARMPFDVAVPACDILVLGKVTVTFLPKRHRLCRPIWVNKNGIPLFLFIM